MRGYLEGSEEHVEDEAVSGATLYDNFPANVVDVRNYLSPLRATSIEAAAHSTTNPSIWSSSTRHTSTRAYAPTSRYGSQN